VKEGKNAVLVDFNICDRMSFLKNSTCVRIMMCLVVNILCSKSVQIIYSHPVHLLIKHINYFTDNSTGTKM
jgi:hypothetical protein